MPTVEVPGTQLFYTMSGTGVPCLVMHGGLCFDHTYLRGLDSLGDVLHLVYYDHRHNGRSGRPPLETLSHAQLAADAEGLRKLLGLGKVVVLGHSYGGFIALEYALRYPDSVSHLILLDTAPQFNYGEAIMSNARARGATPAMLEALAATPAEDEAVKNTFMLVLPLYFARYQPAYEALFAETIMCAACAEHQEQMLATYDLLPRLPEIRCPSLVLVGRHDIICPPSQAHLMQAGLPQAQLVLFEHSGRFLWIEEPQRFSQIVKAWLEQVRASPH